MDGDVVKMSAASTWPLTRGLDGGRATAVGDR